jgi:hypothetical protein
VDADHLVLGEAEDVLPSLFADLLSGAAPRVIRGTRPDPSHEQDDEGGTECDHPITDRTVAEPDKKISEQRHRPGVRIGPMRVRAEDPVADEPDG